MKKIFLIFGLFISIAALTVVTGCQKQAAPTAEVNENSSIDANTAPAVVPTSQTNTNAAAKPNLDISQQDLDNLKAQINSMQYDDLGEPQ